MPTQNMWSNNKNDTFAMWEKGVDYQGLFVVLIGNFCSLFLCFAQKKSRLLENKRFLYIKIPEDAKNLLQLFAQWLT